MPASELTKDGTTVQLIITLTKGDNDNKTVESKELEYGVYAYLTRELYRCTNEGKKFYVDEEQEIDKTTEYKNMLVSLIKLGEAVNRIEAMKPNQQ